MSVLAAACSKEAVGPAPPAPVDWHSLEARPPVPDAGPPRATDKERAVADAYTKALAAPGLTSLGPMFDEDAHLAFPGMKDAHGRADVVKSQETLFDAFDSREVTPTRVLLTDSAQAIMWTMTGVQARDWMGAKATRKPVTIHGLSLLWTKDDSSITDIHIYFDVAAVKGQLGLGPKELRELSQPPKPAGGKQELEQANTPEETAHVTLVRNALDALKENHESDYLDAMTEDVQIETLERGQPITGRRGARDYFKSLRKTIGQLDVTVENAWGAGSFVMAEYSIVGEQLAPIGWIPRQKDAVLKLSVAEIIEIRNSKIAHVWRFDNPSEILSSQ